MTAGGAHGVRRFWLVRHGETEGQSSIRYHGRNDVPLSAVGRAQVAALAPWLRGVAFAHVVHSPLDRAAESARLLIDLAGLRGVPCTVDARLAEISFGACEGMTRDEIEGRWPGFFADYQAGRCDAFPGGEPRAAFAARVGAALDDWRAQPWRGDLLLVAHRGTVRQALQQLAGVAPAGAGVELGSLTVLVELPDGVRVERLGARP